MLKSFIQKLFVLVILTTSLVSPAYATVNYQVENQPHPLILVDHDVTQNALSDSVHELMNQAQSSILS